MEEIMKLLVDYGLSFVLVGYFIYKDYKFNGTMLGVLSEIKEVLAILKEKNGVE